MRIMHVFRAPFGGLFRHVCDLARAQHQLGHQVALVCDSTTGGKAARQTLEQLNPHCSLGITRMPMSRLPGPADALTARRIANMAKQLQPDVLHGHGAKGGVYARLASKGSGASAIYTPHGGSLHYQWSSPAGAAFLSAEKLLLLRSSGLVFVCEYERRTFEQKVGIGNVASLVVHNGLWPEEFTPAELTAGASDLLFIGELRKLKGVDVLIDAMALINANGRKVTATITGYGDEREEFENLVRQKGLEQLVVFTGAMPARKAFSLGRLMIIPSRAESFPYIVLEAIAAHKPVIASNVGGISEVLSADSLVTAGNSTTLARAISSALDDWDSQVKLAEARAKDLKNTSSALIMAEKICKFYKKCRQSDSGRSR